MVSAHANAAPAVTEAALRGRTATFLGVFILLGIAQSILLIVVRLEALRLLGTARAVTLLYAVAGLAAVVGQQGMVTAVEIDTKLAEKARFGLEPWPQVSVIVADGASFEPGPVDAIVAALAPHIRRRSGSIMLRAASGGLCAGSMRRSRWRCSDAAGAPVQSGGRISSHQV